MSNTLRLVNGQLANYDIVAYQTENNMWTMRSTFNGEERTFFTLQQVEEVVNLHNAAVEWVFENYMNSIISQHNIDNGFFVDIANNCEVRINYFWDMINFAKQHNLAFRSNER